jgi:SAM-dependent methyltransferase
VTVMADDKPPAFDGAANDYDRAFTDTLLGRWLRGAVWERLAARFRPGMHVLELGCGTGEDAVWLAQHGTRVTASDVSPAMLEIARAKAAAAGVAELLDVRVIDLANPPAVITDIDGAFSDFGALNCVSDYYGLASWLAASIRPGGHVIFVVMGPTCLWELAWFLLHLDARSALRRLQGGGVEARVAGQTVHVWYPSVRRLQRAFLPWFKVSYVCGVGTFLPPSYLAARVERRPRLFGLLRRVDARLAAIWPLREVGDHYLIDLERVACQGVP